MSTMMDNAAIRAADFLAREAQLDRYRQDVMAYALKVCFNLIFSYLAIGIFALLFGVFKYAVVFSVMVAFFKIVTGGAHSSSSERCIVTGTICFVFLSWLASIIYKNYVFTQQYLIYFAALTAFYCIWMWAPATVPEKPLNSKIQRDRLRIISFSLLFIWISGCGVLAIYRTAGWIIITTAIALIWQSLTLTPLGYRLMRCFDVMLKKVGI